MLIPALVPLALLPLPQDAPPQTVVTAPRSEQPASATSASVTVLDAEDLARTGERSLPRAIARAAGPSVWMQETNLGGGSPILRGLVGQHVLIVIDGVRLNDSSTRLGPNQSLNTVSISIVDRVEVVRGPAAVLYGSDAVGGAILIWTKRSAPAGEGPGGVDGGLDLDASSAAEGGRASAFGTWTGSDDGLIAIGSAEDWGDLHTGDGVQDHVGYHSNDAFGAWEHAFDQHRKLRLSTQVHRDFDVPRTDRLVTGFGQTQPSNAVFDFHLQEREWGVAEWTDQLPTALYDRMQVRAFARHYTEEREIQSLNAGGIPSNTFAHERDEVTGLGAGVDFVRPLGSSHLLTFGLDLERDTVDSSRTNENLTTGVLTEVAGAYAEDSRYTSAGIFAQDEVLSLDPWDLTLGLRYSFFDFGFEPFSGGPDEEGDFDALTGSIQAARDLGQRWRTTFTVAQAFRAPHLDDLAKNATIFGGTELANPDLDPEHSLSEEAALVYAGERVSGALALWHARIEDYIGRVLIDAGDPLTTGDEIYLRENTGVVTFIGAELSSTVGLGAPGSPWSLDAALAWTRGRQDDDIVQPATGTQPYQDVPARRIPPLNGTLGLGWEPATPTRGLGWARLEVVAADTQDELNPEDLSDPRIDPNGTDGWVVVNMDCGGPLGGAKSRSSWHAGVHNLFDESYRVHGSGFDGPGLGAVVGLSWRP